VTVGDDTIRRSGFEETALRDPLIGTVLDGYQLQSVLGTGAMGIVYRALHQVIGKPVAVKVLKPDVADDPDMVARLIREARTVNAIRHPGIVDIFGFGQMPVTRQPYIVMDLLEGEPLDAFVQRAAPVPLKDAFPILDDLLAALAAAHGVGVIHRDLKPGNVFLEKQPEGRPRLKLLDFGLARQADRAGGSIRPTNPGTLLGTPAFMAPEQVLGEKVTPATDLYAVGGIAYQMLTGHLPHEAPTAIEVITQKMKHDAVPPIQWQSNMGQPLSDWVMGFLEKDVERRTASAEDARRALKKLLESADDQASEAPTQPKRLASGNKSGMRASGVVPKRQWQESRTEPVDNDAEEVSKSGPIPIPGSAEPTHLMVESPFKQAQQDEASHATWDEDATQPPKPLAGVRPWEIKATVGPAAAPLEPAVKKSLLPLVAVLAVLGAAVAVGAFLLLHG